MLHNTPDALEGVSQDMQEYKCHTCAHSYSIHMHTRIIHLHICRTKLAGGEGGKWQPFVQIEMQRLENRVECLGKLLGSTAKRNRNH